MHFVLNVSFCLLNLSGKFGGLARKSVAIPLGCNYFNLTVLSQSEILL